MKHGLVVCALPAFLVGISLTVSVTAQTTAYRQASLSSDLQEIVANNHNAALKNPWGIAFLPGLPFFIANNGSGLVTALDASGSSVGLSGFGVSSVAGGGLGTPTGIVSDPNSFFVGPGFFTPFIVVTDDGGIFATKTCSPLLVVLSQTRS